MGKRGKSQVKGDRFPKKKVHNKDKIVNEDMDDEIDAFHKQRDLVSLDVNKDMEDSDDDEELPVFDFEDGDVDKDESDEDEDEDDIKDTGFAAKMAKQQKYLREKFGGVEDDMHGDDEDEDDEQKAVWGGRKDIYYDADNVDFEIRSSDDESPAEEEAEVIRLQKENAKSMSMADFGVEDSSEDDSDRELTLEEISVKGKTTKKSSLKTKGAENTGTDYEEVKKDLSALSKEELMDVLFSSAPELVGLLSELNDATDQLENKVDPLLNKVKNGEIMLEGGVRYLELKKLLLLSYCQAITFYLILKSEGQPVRDHPVLARLVEIRSLLDKTKQLDENLPAELEEILNKSKMVKSVVKLGKENGIASDSVAKDHVSSLATTDIQEAAEPNNKVDSVMVDLIKDSEKKSEKRKRQNEQVGLESMKMLKVRADLEEKLKQKGIFSSTTPKLDKAQKRQKPLNRKLETYDDFDDDTGNAQVAAQGLTNGRAGSLSSLKFAQLLAANKSKVVSGDDDLPKRDDIGERRRRHEVNVLQRAGIEAEDDGGDEIGAVETDGDDVEMDDEGESEEGSEDEFYNQVKQQREAKLAAKAQIYSRDSTLPVASLPETVDGKRHISYQIQKNRGLTRQRNKKLKNPRKKYKEKHKKAVKNRQGQVRDVKTPKSRYPGEISGINASISRSVRLKS
ncbi:protein THALLO [Cannabis sativa]|uniref:protein THALLO n=1 Tax=Cannabis sativa TaxID=3483 RepID=UPI0029CA0FDC|nr:protein THALLO [Cannabis sativa]XP_030492049.2 protein THALLO [Cannabis sativa]XP_060964415.1 protein THALLO [Cannabis sativa]XP_060964416.1 protein THALLO [Cannabis sativa]